VLSRNNLRAFISHPELASKASRVEGPRAAFRCRVICLVEKESITAAQVAAARFFDFAQNDFLAPVRIFAGHHTTRLASKHDAAASGYRLGRAGG
jgi:hypothetical protein